MDARERHLRRLAQRAAFSSRDRKRALLAILYAERHKDLREFVARGPVQKEPPPQMELPLSKADCGRSRLRDSDRRSVLRSQDHLA